MILLDLVWLFYFMGRNSRIRNVEFVRVEHYISNLQELSNDKTIPKYATHLVYLTSADNPNEIEHKIIYSILSAESI